MIKEIRNKKEKEMIATKILYSLPEWFGVEEYIKDYIEKVQEMLCLAYYREEEVVGFTALNSTSDDTVEIYVMGILKEYHRIGIGRSLYQYMENYARKLGYEYIQVKTVQSGHYKEYDQTNNYYKAMGFKELECFPDMWDKHNPCQIYVKYIKESYA